MADTADVLIPTDTRHLLSLLHKADRNRKDFVADQLLNLEIQLRALVNSTTKTPIPDWQEFTHQYMTHNLRMVFGWQSEYRWIRSALHKRPEIAAAIGKVVDNLQIGRKWVRIWQDTLQTMVDLGERGYLVPSMSIPQPVMNSILYWSAQSPVEPPPQYARR